MRSPLSRLFRLPLRGCEISRPLGGRKRVYTLFYALSLSMRMTAQDMSSRLPESRAWSRMVSFKTAGSERGLPESSEISHGQSSLPAVTPSLTMTMTSPWQSSKGMICACTACIMPMGGVCALILSSCLPRMTNEGTAPLLIKLAVPVSRSMRTISTPTEHSASGASECERR